MKLTRLALSNPVAGIAAILLVLMLGTIGLLSLPIQMIPDVQRPFIQINTGWRAAAPEEMESEIVEPQEDAEGLDPLNDSADDLPFRHEALTTRGGPTSRQADQRTEGAGEAWPRATPPIVL